MDADQQRQTDEHLVGTAMAVGIAAGVVSFLLLWRTSTLRKDILTWIEQNEGMIYPAWVKGFGPALINEPIPNDLSDLDK